MTLELLAAFLIGNFVGSFLYRLWRNRRQERRGQLPPHQSPPVLHGANFTPRPTYQKPPYPFSTARERREVTMETITINKAQLQSALAQWEQDARDGKTRSHEETLALPVKQVAQESANHMWDLLQSIPRAEVETRHPDAGPDTIVVQGGTQIVAQGG